MKLIEVSHSIHGELPHLGAPCTIIRFEGCNLQCPYCDAPSDGARDWTLDEVLEKAALGPKHILITGGEPLIHVEAKTLMNELVKLNYTVTVETNGTVKIDRGVAGASSSIVMDVKLFRNDFTVEATNLQWLDPGSDAIKFVYAGRHDIDKANKFLATYQHRIAPGLMVIFSPLNVAEPCFDEFLVLAQMWPELDLRLQCQIHKVLGVK